MDEVVVKVAILDEVALDGETELTMEQLELIAFVVLSDEIDLLGEPVVVVPLILMRYF